MHRRKGLFKALILPGLIFQSLVISGGYGTGAELSEFFFPYGPMGGLLGLSLVTFGIWALVCAVTFEFARKHRTFNYKPMMRGLLGRGWILFELCYVAMLLLVLGVMAATAGINLTYLLGAPGWVGTLLVSVCVIALVLGGTKAVEDFLSLWSYVLYAVYFVFLLVCFVRFGDTIAHHLVHSPQVEPGWVMGGAKYAFYNLGIIPAVLFTVRYAQSRREAVMAGIIAAAIAVVPAILLFVAMTGLYPHVAAAQAPVNEIFSALNIPWLNAIFQIVLFGTLIETGSGMIKAFSDRFEGGWSERGRTPPFWLRPVVTSGSVILGICLSTLGLTPLIQKGYGTISWGFLAVFVAPMLTIGVYKMARRKR